jgi:hypothetical protein
MKHPDGLPHSRDVLRVPVPLVIGVSGHRDLRPGDIDDLTKKVHQIFSDLRERYPATPFILLSALAEGADRLVARVALEPHNRTRLVVPLPMPQSLYEADFDSATSLEDFRGLLAQADYSFEIALPEGVSQDVVAQPGPTRDHQYELQAKYLARRSQILIALWDGVDSGKTGGTSEVIKFQIQGLPSGEGGHLEPSELFPVRHIVTPRQSNPVPAGTPFSLLYIYPPAFGGDLGKAATYYEQAFGNANEFNRAVIQGGPKLAAEAQRSKKDCVGELDEGKLSAKEALMLHRYGFADALAIRYQGIRSWVELGLHALVFLSYFFFALSAEQRFHQNWVLIASMSCLAVAYVGYLLAKHFFKFDSKVEDYRAVAEGCRVRFFWQLAGIHDSVLDCYLGEQRTELDWIRRALLAWEIDLEAGWPGPWADHRERIEFVMEHWVDKQQSYFKNAVHKSKRKARTLKWAIWACILAAILLAVLAGFSKLVHDWPENRFQLSAALAVDTLLALGAVMHHYTEGRAHREHRKQYARMLVIFQTAARVVRPQFHLSNIDGARNWLRKLGEEALQESGSWVLLHRSRPLELPHP